MENLTAKFNSKCAETGKAIKKGEPIAYDRVNKKAYCKDSNAFKNQKDSNDTAAHVQAQENAYFDNWAQQNGI